MKTKEALEIKKAIICLADFLKIEPQNLVSSICFLDKEKFAKFKEASDLWNIFEESDIVTRGSLLGITITQNAKNN
jgi:hypothetical protein